MADPQVRLPSGFEDAAPVAVSTGLKLPAGFEDAAPVKPPLGHDMFGDIPDNLYTRIGARIKSNFNLPEQIRSAGNAISEAISDVKQNGLFPANHVSRLPEVIQSLKDTYKVPANVIGDLITGGIMHFATPGVTEPGRIAPQPEAAPPAEVPAPQSIRPTPSTMTGESEVEFIRRRVQEQPPTQIKGVQSQLGTPEEQVRIREMMSGRNAAKQDLESGRTVPAPTPAAPPTPEPTGEAYPGEGASTKAGLERANANQPIKQAISDVVDQHIPKESPSNFQAKAALEKLLSDAMGGKALEKGVPIKNQAAAGGTPPSGLPEGFTPADSSALKGYKYNPAEREFEVMSSNGQHYIYGDVSPKQYFDFTAAESKGKAWNALRSSDSPLVAKVLNGKRVAIKPAVPTEEVKP